MLCALHLAWRCAVAYCLLLPLHAAPAMLTAAAAAFRTLRVAMCATSTSKAHDAAATAAATAPAERPDAKNYLEARPKRQSIDCR
jgi:hypothetical protein